MRMPLYNCSGVSGEQHRDPRVGVTVVDHPKQRKSQDHVAEPIGPDNQDVVQHGWKYTPKGEELQLVLGAGAIFATDEHGLTPKPPLL